MLSPEINIPVLPRILAHLESCAVIHLKDCISVHRESPHPVERILAPLPRNLHTENAIVITYITECHSCGIVMHDLGAVGNFHRCDTVGFSRITAEKVGSP